MFVMGADWYRNNVWHDASKELPEKGKNVLASTLSPEGRGIMEGGVTMVVDRGLLECDRSHKSTFKTWAYLAANKLKSLYTSSIPDNGKADLWKQRADELEPQTLK